MQSSQHRSEIEMTLTAYAQRNIASLNQQETHTVMTAGSRFVLDGQIQGADILKVQTVTEFVGNGIYLVEQADWRGARRITKTLSGALEVHDCGAWVPMPSNMSIGGRVVGIFREVPTH